MSVPGSRSAPTPTSPWSSALSAGGKRQSVDGASMGIRSGDDIYALGPWGMNG